MASRLQDLNELCFEQGDESIALNLALDHGLALFVDMVLIALEVNLLSFMLSEHNAVMLCCLRCNARHDNNRLLN